MTRLFDLLTCIRNGQQVGLSQVIFPFSAGASHKHGGTPATYRLFNVLDLLRREGFIRGFSFKSGTPRKNKKYSNYLEIYLKYDAHNNRVIRSITPVSTNGRRVYLSSESLWQPQSTTGIFVLSTPRGILSDAEARRLNVGGEVLFSVV